MLGIVLKKTQISSFYKLILGEIKKQGWRYGVYLGVIASTAIVNVLPPKLYAFFAEHATAMQTINLLSAEEFLEELIFFGSLLAVVMLINNFTRVLCEEWVCLRIEASLRGRFMDYTQKLPFETFDAAQRGDWLTNMSEDIRSVEKFITMVLPNEIQEFLILVVIGIMFVTQSGTLALILMASALLIAMFNLYIQQKVNPILDQLRDMHGQVFQEMLENFEGIRSIRSFAAENFILKKFEARVQGIITQGLKVVKFVALMVGTNAFAVNIFTAGVLSMIAWMLRSKSLTVADVFTFPFYIGMFYSSVFALVRGVFDWNDFFIHGKRLTAFIDAASEAQNSASLVSVEDNVLVQGIAIEGVQFGYLGKPALTDPFNYSTKVGELTLIKGRSGCGKSTFLEVLAGLRSCTADKVVLYDASGTKVKTVASKDKIKLAIQFATYVEQKPYIFEGKLRDNVSFNLENVPDATLQQALEVVNLNEQIEKRGGLDFKILDNGRNLSEGQKHRVGLARALLQNRPFILLDEPFAALDPVSINHLCETLNQLKATHGIVIVSHISPETLECNEVLDFELLAKNTLEASPQLESAVDRGGELFQHLSPFTESSIPV